MVVEAVPSILVEVVEAVLSILVEVDSSETSSHVLSRPEFVIRFYH